MPSRPFAQLIRHRRRHRRNRLATLKMRNVPTQFPGRGISAVWIDPDRRYSSAGELGRDIAHFQRGQPVAAMPTSMAYQLRKWTGRHRLPVAIAAVVLLVLVSLAIVWDIRLRREAA